MSKNTELLSGILTCMIKLTDKLHATNNKMIDLNDKFDNLSFKNVDELSGKVSEINTKIDSISSQISNINLSGDLEKFIDEIEIIPDDELFGTGPLLLYMCTFFENLILRKTY